MLRALATAFALATPCSCAPSPGGGGTRLPNEIEEPSGAAASYQHLGVVWVHGDSGTDAAVFAVRGVEILARVDLRDANNSDWEDIAVHDDRVWIGDIGNNGQNRKDLRVYVIDEPDPAAGPQTVSTVDTVRFRYPDQDERPNWDAESLFFHDDSLWLLTKHRADSSTTLYRFPALTGDVVLERVADFDVGGSKVKFGGRVSGATTSPDGKHLAVLSYHAVFVFALETGVQPLASLVKRFDLRMADLRQCEAIAWTADGLVILNEDRRAFVVTEPLRADRTRFPD